MNLRKITSLTALLSSMLTLLTSIILYIVPAGRVAYWSDWHLWGLSKTQWGDIHINLGFLLVLSILLHIYYNWKPILAYLKDKKKNLKIFTRDFNIALAITLMVAIVTYFIIPPFSSILDLSAKIKDDAALKYGEPPFGHAELSPFKSLLKKMGLDYVQSVARLEQAGITIESPDQIFLDIAKKQGINPKQLYDIIQPDAPAGTKKILPAIPAPGTGSKTISAICETYRLNLEEIKIGLKSKGISIQKDQNVKTIASMNNITPIQLYDLIKQVSERKE